MSQGVYKITNIINNHSYIGVSKNGESMLDVYQDYQQLTLGSFKNIWYNYNWKHVIV